MGTLWEPEFTVRFNLKCQPCTAARCPLSILSMVVCGAGTSVSDTSCVFYTCRCYCQAEGGQKYPARRGSDFRRARGWAVVKVGVSNEVDRGCLNVQKHFKMQILYTVPRRASAPEARYHCSIAKNIILIVPGYSSESVTVGEV